MPSYNTMPRDEKSSLLGEDYPRPILIEHFRDVPCRNCNKCRNGRKRASGCCVSLCKFFAWVFITIFAVLFVLRHTNLHLQLPGLRLLGSPAQVPVAAATCPSAPVPYKPGQLKYTFDVGSEDTPRSFFFGQRWIEKPKAGPAPRFIQTAGQVIVQAAPFGTSEPVTVDLDVNLSHEELADTIVIDQESTGLTFKSRAFLGSFDGVDPCVSVVATISVASSTNLSTFDIDTVVLPVELKKSLRLISDNVFIHSTAGSISSEQAGFDSRKIQVETTSNTISGNFPLFDFLSVKSMSGSVDIDVKPKEDAENHLGNFQVRTASGHIQVNTITSSIPNRNFTTQVNTVSGSVSGSFLLGVASNINSGSGTIDTKFYTAGEVANRTCILNSVSGGIRAAVYDESYPIGSVRSNVQSRAGQVDVQFPAAWEGHIQGQTTVGSISITGDGVTIIKDVTAVPGRGRIVIAEKGDGYSNLSTETVTGAISVRFV